MFKRVNTINIIVCLLAIALGFLIQRQAVAFYNSQDVLKEDSIMKGFYEVVELANSNSNLQDEINHLKVKNDSFTFDIKDKAKIKSDLEEKLKNYKIINGVESMQGRGVELKIEGSMVTEEIIDLINGIRNIKPDAISINNKRVVYRSYFVIGSDNQLEFDSAKMAFPLYIQVIGDPDTLKKSLDRSGGILDILEKNSFGKITFFLEQKDNLNISAYDGKIRFNTAKIFNY